MRSGAAELRPSHAKFCPRVEVATDRQTPVGHRLGGVSGRERICGGVQGADSNKKRKTSTLEKERMEDEMDRGLGDGNVGRMAPR